MEHARPPAELSLEGGPASRAEAWLAWLRQLKVFLKASGVSKQPSDVQASLLINLIGPDGHNIFSTLRFAKEEDRDDIEKVIDKFNEYFGTKTDTTLVRFEFFTRSQEKGECIDEYVTALRILSQQCEFESLEDGLLRDRIVCGVWDAAVRDRLLKTEYLTLEKAIEICQVSNIPALPWSKVGSEIFEYERKKFLIVVDYFSNFVEVSPITRVAKSVVTALKDIFSRHGIPHEFITDNDAAYASKEFYEFMVKWGIKHSTSSPNHPLSNDKSKRAVRTVKALLLKSIKTKSDFYSALLKYRSTARNVLASPAQLLMGRRVNTRLPMHMSKIQTDSDNEIDYQNIHDQQQTSGRAPKRRSCYKGRCIKRNRSQKGQKRNRRQTGQKRNRRQTVKVAVPQASATCSEDRPVEDEPLEDESLKNLLYNWPHVYWALISRRRAERDERAAKRLGYKMDSYNENIHDQQQTSGRASQRRININRRKTVKVVAPQASATCSEDRQVEDERLEDEQLDGLGSCEDPENDATMPDGVDADRPHAKRQPVEGPAAREARKIYRDNENIHDQGQEGNRIHLVKVVTPQASAIFSKDKQVEPLQDEPLEDEPLEDEQLDGLRSCDDPENDTTTPDAVDADRPHPKKQRVERPAAKKARKTDRDNENIHDQGQERKRIHIVKVVTLQASATCSKDKQVEPLEDEQLDGLGSCEDPENDATTPDAVDADRPHANRQRVEGPAAREARKIDRDNENIHDQGQERNRIHLVKVVNPQASATYSKDKQVEPLQDEPLQHEPLENEPLEDEHIDVVGFCEDPKKDVMTPDAVDADRPQAKRPRVERPAAKVARKKDRDNENIHDQQQTSGGAPQRRSYWVTDNMGRRIRREPDAVECPAAGFGRRRQAAKKAKAK